VDDHRLVRAFQQLEQSDRRIAQVVDRVDMSLQQHLAEHAERKRIDATHELVARMFDHASSYTNAVIVAGYAGFFAIWGFTRDIVPPLWHAVAALLFAASATAFVLWQVYVMIHTGIAHAKLGKGLRVGGDPAAALDELTKAEQRAAVARFYAWAVVMIFTVVTGVAGIAVLVWHFAAPLMRTVLAATLLATPAVASDQSEKDAPLSIMGLSRDEAELFADGVAVGILFYNNGLLLDGKQPLFCQPPDLQIDGRLVWRLGEGNLAGPHRRETLGVAAVDELRRVYPCGPPSK
jgi:hypothetical protein